MLIGLMAPSDGSIFYQGRSVRDDLPPLSGGAIGYVPEEAHLYPHLSGWEYLQLVGRLREMQRNVLEPKIKEFLQVFSLWDEPRSLSSIERHAPESLTLGRPAPQP